MTGWEQVRELTRCIVYEQFYNPIFGRRQLGIIAQELKQVLPRAVGVVPKRAVGSADDENPTIITDVHVLNSESLFMANVGATQELYRLQTKLKQAVDQLLGDTLNEASVIKEAQEEVARLKARQVDLEQIAKQAHERSADAANMGRALDQISKDRDQARVEHTGLAARVERLHDLVTSETKEQNTLHRDAMSDRVQLRTTLDNAIKQLEALSLVDKEHESRLSALERADEDLIKQNLKLESTVAQLGKEMQDAKSENGQLGSSVQSLLETVKSLRTDLNKQAGEEIVEQRRVAEANLAFEKTKADAERERHEHAMQSAAAAAALEAEREARQDAAARARSQAEIALKEESATRLAEASHAAELEALKAKAAIARETASAEQEAETRRERDNHDVRVAMERLKAEEARAHTSSMIRTMFGEAISAVKLLAGSPDQVLGGVAVIFLLAVGVYGAREGMILWRSYWQRRLGQPALIRETSLGSSKMRTRLVLLGKSFFGATVALRRKGVGLLKMLVLPPPSPESAAKAARDLRDERAAAKRAEESFLHAMKDVVLPSNKALQINRIARSTRSAHKDKTSLRHVLFYGPPGTGKTMVCRHLAQWCGLDYAIMSGADVAPLKDRAVTELHALFAWAKQSKRGVLLFIDEADAFLASRDRSDGMSEHLRNALTALLFHTGSASSKIMLVLATNRPGDLDRAVLDRIDESVQFDLPGVQERQLLLAQYFDTYVRPMIAANSEIGEAALRSAAGKTAGFSGREVSKLMSSVQAHLYGREQHAEEMEATTTYDDDTAAHSSQANEGLYLSLEFFNQVLDAAVLEHQKLDSMHHKQDYGDIFGASLPSSPGRLSPKSLKPLA